MTKTTAQLLLFFISITSFSISQANTASFKYEGKILESWGASGLAIGETISGSFTYGTLQRGQEVHSPDTFQSGSTRDYNNGVITVKAHNQLVSSTGGFLQVRNDVIPSFGSHIWDSFEIHTSERLGSIKMGTINGFNAVNIGLFLLNQEGLPFTSSALPLEFDLSNYHPLNKMFTLIFDSNGGGVRGEITKIESCTLHPKIPYFGCVN